MEGTPCFDSLKEAHRGKNAQFWGVSNIWKERITRPLIVRILCLGSRTSFGKLWSRGPKLVWGHPNLTHTQVGVFVV